MAQIEYYCYHLYSQQSSFLYAKMPQTTELIFGGAIDTVPILLV